MTLANMIVPLLTFGAPLCALVFFALAAGRSGLTERKAGIGLFTLAFLAAAVGVVHFETPVRMEFLLPLSTDNSGYFDPSLQLHWARYLWVFLSAALCLGLTLFDGEKLFRDDRGNLRFLFLTASFLFLALAYLSENTLLSLMFIEFTVFLLHSFDLENSRNAVELERVSYFKRNTFLFLGLLGMLGLTASKELTNSSVVLLGVVIYIMALLLSRHNFTDWRKVAIAVAQIGTAFFLLGRGMHEEMSPELWVPLAVLFAVATAAFTIFSFATSQALHSAFWFIFALVGYLLFLRFSSAKPVDEAWGAFEVLGLSIGFVFTVLFRFGHRRLQPWQKVSLWASGFLLMVLLANAPDFAPAGAGGLGRESPTKILLLAGVTFLMSLTAMRAIALSLKSEPSENTNFLFALAPVALALCAVIAIGLRIADVHQGNSLLRLAGNYFTDLSGLSRLAALGLGCVVGATLGVSQRWMSWVKDRERKMEDLFPRIDPIVVRWNQVAVEAPVRAIGWAGNHFVEGVFRATAKVQETDRIVFADKMPNGAASYGSALSQLLRFLHSGHVRFYFFFGVALSILGAALFLLGGGWI